MVDARSIKQMLELLGQIREKVERLRASLEALERTSSTAQEPPVPIAEESRKDPI